MFIHRPIMKYPFFNIFDNFLEYIRISMYTVIKAR